jgi:hypothetical protein
LHNIADVQSRKYPFRELFVALSYIRWVFDTVCYEGREILDQDETKFLRGGAMKQEIAAMRDIMPAAERTEARGQASKFTPLGVAAIPTAQHAHVFVDILSSTNVYNN